MDESMTVVGVYANHNGAESAIRALHDAGIPFARMSIIGKDYQVQERAVGYFNLGDRIRFFGKLGAFWGTLAGILLGAFVMVIPVFGHLIILGPLAATIVSGAEGAVVGGLAGVVGGALASIGVPKDSAIRYATAVEADRFLLVLKGSEREAQQAQSILLKTGAESAESFHRQASAPTAS